MTSRRRQAKGAPTRSLPATSAAAPSHLVWVVMALAGLGLAVSGYLALTYLSNTEVVCYGLGDCERVQTSAYSRIYGVPVALLGLLSYVGIIGLALGRLILKGDIGFLSLLGIVTLAIAGTVFSAYLTYVEFFVIYAACPWCLTSAAITAAIMAVAWVQVRRELARSPG